MRLFSLLLSDTEVQLAPGKKVLPGSQVSQLLDLQQLQEMVIAEAEEYRRQVDAECDELRQQAKEQGFAAGEKTWASSVASLEKAADAISEEAEQAMVPGVVKAVERIIGESLEMSPELISSIVRQSLRSVAQFKQITIYCRKEDLEHLEKEKPKYRKMLERCETLQIRDRQDVQPGGCIIETEGGIVNAQLSQQLAALARALKGRS
jgi:type III secretion protein L